ERQGSVPCYWSANVLMPSRITQVQVAPGAGDAAIHERRVEHQLACPNPVLTGFERGRIERNAGLLPLEVVDISCRLLPRMIYRIALVDGANRDPVVVLGWNLNGAGIRDRQRQSHRGDRGIVPRPRNLVLRG